MTGPGTRRRPRLPPRAPAGRRACHPRPRVPAVRTARRPIASPRSMPVRAGDRRSANLYVPSGRDCAPPGSIPGRTPRRDAVVYASRNPDTTDTRGANSDAARHGSRRWHQPRACGARPRAPDDNNPRSNPWRCAVDRLARTPHTRRTGHASALSTGSRHPYSRSGYNRASRPTVRGAARAPYGRASAHAPMPAQPAPVAGFHNSHSIAPSPAGLAPKVPYPQRPSFDYPWVDDGHTASTRSCWSDTPIGLASAPDGWTRAATPRPPMHHTREACSINK